ncbi:hypothetical protein [Romboutsia sp.]|uniref:hypothetical protein n=1 Tax=Romboutsia sp. TaxID=1965302 RepID=UPI003F401226
MIVEKLGNEFNDDGILYFEEAIKKVSLENIYINLNFTPSKIHLRNLPEYIRVHEALNFIGASDINSYDDLIVNIYYLLKLKQLPFTNGALFSYSDSKLYQIQFRKAIKTSDFITLLIRAYVYYLEYFKSSWHSSYYIEGNAKTKIRTLLEDEIQYLIDTDSIDTAVNENVGKYFVSSNSRSIDYMGIRMSYLDIA